MSEYDLQKEFIDMSEAMDILGVSRPTVYRWLKEGKLEGLRVGRQWRFSRKELTDFLRQENEEGGGETSRAAKQAFEFFNERVPSSNPAAFAPEELLKLMIKDAVELGAASLHLTCSDDRLCLRYRVDGGLVPVTDFPPNLAAELQQVLRGLMGERTFRHLTLGGAQVRVSRLGALRGEKFVLRLDSSLSEPLPLSLLVKQQGVLARLEALLGQPGGLVIITGLPGSGKTTTAYAMLAEFASQNLNIMTVEQQPELLPEWAVQIAVSDEYPYSRIMKDLGHQEPDLLFCDEVADRKIAESLCRLSLIGLKVVTCLYAPGTAGALLQLLDLGVPASLIAHSLRGVLSQHLVRRICEQCVEQRDPFSWELKLLDRAGVDQLPNSLASGAGCSNCGGTGYRGRLALHGLCEPDRGILRALHALENEKGNEEQLTTACGDDGLRTAALEAALDGRTSLEEVEDLMSTTKN